MFLFFFTFSGFLMLKAPEYISSRTTKQTLRRAPCPSKNQGGSACNITRWTASSGFFCVEKRAKGISSFWTCAAWAALQSFPNKARWREILKLVDVKCTQRQLVHLDVNFCGKNDVTNLSNKNCLKEQIWSLFKSKGKSSTFQSHR